MLQVLKHILVLQEESASILREKNRYDAQGKNVEHGASESERSTVEGIE